MVPMISSHTETVPAVGISVSESPDLGVLGLSGGHLRDAMAEIALHLLASGRSLAYGGDLRQHGFTELLAELVGRYGDHPRHGGTIVITDYLARTPHIQEAVTLVSRGLRKILSNGDDDAQSICQPSSQ